MNFSKLFISCFVILSFQMVKAQQAAPTTVNDDDDVVVIVDDKTTREIRRGSSEYNRMNKNYLIAAQLYGHGPISGKGVGLSLGKFADRNSLILLEWVRNSAEAEYTGAESLRNYSVGLHFKKFEKNTFFWRMGADYRYASYSYAGATSAKSFESDSFNFSTAIGTEWFWRSFTLGVDWIGASVPLYSKVKNEVVSGAFTSSSLDDERKKYTTDTTGVYARFYVGLAF